MELSLSHAVKLTLTFAGLISIIVALPVGETDGERANLSDTINSINNVSEVQPSLVPVVESTETPIEIIVEVTGSPENPEKTQEMTVLVLQPNQNIFSGLAEKVSNVDINGAVMEAFKLAQVSIALFAHSLATQFGGTSSSIASLSNATKIIGRF